MAVALSSLFLRVVKLAKWMVTDDGRRGRRRQRGLLYKWQWFLFFLFGCCGFTVAQGERKTTIQDAFTEHSVLHKNYYIPNGFFKNIAMQVKLYL